MRPYCGIRRNARNVGQIQRRNLGAQLAVVAIAGLHQHHAARQTSRAGQRSRSSAISCLILKVMSSGTSALRRRSSSLVHSCGRDNHKPANSLDHWQATETPRLGSCPAALSSAAPSHVPWPKPPRTIAAQLIRLGQQRWNGLLLSRVNLELRALLECEVVSLAVGIARACFAHFGFMAP